MGENDAWTELNRAITDGSLYTAALRRLRRYLRAVDYHRLSAGPSLPETIQRLIAHRESQRQARWTVIDAAAAIIAASASVLGLIAIWR